ncbi:hypothetical protein BAVI_19559, partial [Neobacillus vireti LMG 21834]
MMPRPGMPMQGGMGAGLFGGRGAMGPMAGRAMMGPGANPFGGNQMMGQMMGRQM